MTYELQITIPNLFKQQNRLNPTQEKALKYYSGDNLYPFINRITRGKLKPTNKQTTKTTKINKYNFTPEEYDRFLNIAIDTLEILEEIFESPLASLYVLPRRTALYRSIDKKYQKNFINDDVLYSTYQDNAYTSTTINLNVARVFKDVDAFKTKLYLLPGIPYNMAIVDSLSASVKEQEVLLNKNCVYFYIGKVEINNETIKSTILHEFILLPNMEVYKQISRPVLESLGRKIHQEYEDILRSVNIFQERNKDTFRMGFTKYKYISELEYLMQVIITKPKPLPDPIWGVTIYTYFEVNALKLQRLLFMGLTDLISLHTVFIDGTAEVYLLRKHLDNIQWILYLMKIQKLDIQRYIKAIKLPSIDTREKLQSYLRNELLKDKKLLEEKLIEIQNKGGRRLRAN